VVVDPAGDVWIATASAGVVRYQPSSQTWVYYTTASGLPSNDIRAIYLDQYASSGRTVYFATDNGVAAYSGD
jgi:ligand-binding sensor domain-containing protein